MTKKGVSLFEREEVFMERAYNNRALNARGWKMQPGIGLFGLMKFPVLLLIDRGIYGIN
jgi:hypothetical protein